MTFLTELTDNKEKLDAFVKEYNEHALNKKPENENKNIFKFGVLNNN